MSEYSSLPSLPYGKYFKPAKLKGGDSSTDGAIIAIVVVVIVILLVAIILAACWGGCTGSNTETVYVTGPNGQPVAMRMSKKKAEKMRASKMLRDLPPLNPHRRSGKSYDSAAAGNQVVELGSEAEARQLLSGGDNAMIFLYMDGCGFCDKAKQVFNHALAQQHRHVTLAKMNSNKCQALCGEHNITGFPTFLTNFGGKVAAHVGFKAKPVMDSILASAGAGAGMRMATGKGGVVHEMKDAEHARAMMQDSKQKVVLFLYMPWCGYCKKQKPVLDELAARHGNVKFLAINAEHAGKKIAEAMSIRGFPAFVTNFGGAAPKLHVGYKDAAAFAKEVLGM
jgi:thiol-disulfide isomerase/thioredoxin